MAEEQKESQVTKEPQRVTTKNPKKVVVGKRLAEHNHRRREEKKREQAKLERTRVNQYYRIGAVMGPAGPRPLCGLLALGVTGGLVYYIYQTKKAEQPSSSSNPQHNNPKPHPQAIATQTQTNKFEMD